MSLNPDIFFWGEGCLSRDELKIGPHKNNILTVRKIPHRSTNSVSSKGDSFSGRVGVVGFVVSYPDGGQKKNFVGDEGSGTWRKKGPPTSDSPIRSSLFHAAARWNKGEKNGKWMGKPTSGRYCEAVFNFFGALGSLYHIFWTNIDFAFQLKICSTLHSGYKHTLGTRKKSMLITGICSYPITE